ncbi:unnamed protein product [Dicrocoelium dendriticum]|nr:unnamed protein product [Dicrocoelium dendriticum]
MPPVVKIHRNVTIYFGQKYSISKLGFIVSSLSDPVSDITIQFGGPKSIDKVVNLDKDCTLQSEPVRMHVCDRTDLSGHPFTNVTVDARGLVRFHVFGMPFYYPKVGLLASEKTADPALRDHLELKCMAFSCGSNALSKLEALALKQSGLECTRYGRIVQCKNLDLVRIHQPMEDGQTLIPDTILVSEGQILPDVSQIMTEMELLQASTDRLFVKFPRTHPYFGQYKCRCHADDELSSIVESEQTSLNASDFDRDLVFQRNYTAVVEDQPIDAILGFLEIPHDPPVSFFKLVISGHSLTDKLDLNATFLENGQFTSMGGEYAKTVQLQAFPRTMGATYAWPIPAYRMELQDAWPDCVDGEPTWIEWKTTDDAMPHRVVRDQLRTIVLSPSNEGTIRAWVWQNDMQLLDIRAYYQSRHQTDHDAKEVYLQKSSCVAGASPERVAWAKIQDNECVTGGMQLTPECVRTQSGFAIRFNVQEPSASDSYTLYQTDAGDDPDRQLAKAANPVQNLQTELDAADVTLNIVALSDSENANESQMELAVIVQSKVLVDNSACHRMLVALDPTWSFPQRLENPLTTAETLFTISVPNDLKLLTMELELRVEASDDTKSDLVTRRSLTVANPRGYEINLMVMESEGLIKWPAIPSSFHQLLDKYEVEVFNEYSVCGVLSKLDNPEVQQELRSAEGTPLYKVSLGEYPEFMSPLKQRYVVKVTPVFKSKQSDGTIRGKTVETELMRGSLTETTLKTDQSVSSRTARVYVIPSQPAPCLRNNPLMTAEFDLRLIGEDTAKPDYLKQVIFEPDTLEKQLDYGRWYTVQNLQPGRRYEINATVHYPKGLSDEPSTAVLFWTADEVRISVQDVFASPEEYVAINCSGVVGTSGPYQKRLEWKRNDGTPIPDGASVEVVSTATSENNWTEIVSLQFDRIEPGQAATYACFVRPSVMEVLGKPDSPPTVRLVISELELNEDSRVAAGGENVVVTCETKQSSELVWIAPCGRIIPGEPHESKPYAIHKSSLESGTSSILHIPSAKFEDTGDYVCSEKGSNSSRIFRLRMNEEIHIEQDKGSSRKANSRLHLRCEATLGEMGQHVSWYRRQTSTAPWESIKRLMDEDASVSVNSEPAGNQRNILSSLQLTNTPGTSGEFACVIESRTDNKEDDDSGTAAEQVHQIPGPSASMEIAYEPVLDIEQIDNQGHPETVLRCNGYPAHESDRLHWIFLPPGEGEDNAVLIGPSAQTINNVDESTMAAIRATFRLGDSAPATWPGASGPLMLAASKSIVSQEDEATSFTPERLELFITKDPERGLDERIRDGSLVCQYRRPEAVILMNEGVPVIALRKYEPDAHVIMAEEIVPVKELSNKYSHKVALSGSGLSAISQEGTENVASLRSTLSRQWSLIYLILFRFLWYL